MQTNSTQSTLSRVFYANAKINLFLRVIKRDGKYHKIATLIIPYKEIADKIQLKISLISFKSATKIEVMNQKRNSPIHNNVLFKLIDYLRSQYSIENDIEINLTKNIPIGSGLGGASSDVFFTLQAITDILKLKMNNKTTKAICNEISMDSYFFKFNRPAIVYQPENKIIPVKIINLSELNIEVINSDILCRTEEIFNLHEIINSNEDKYNLIIESLYKNSTLIIEELFNDLKITIEKLFPKLSKITNELIKTNSHVIYTGSGSSIITINKKKSFR